MARVKLGLGRYVGEGIRRVQYAGYCNDETKQMVPI